MICDDRVVPGSAGIQILVRIGFGIGLPQNFDARPVRSHGLFPLLPSPYSLRPAGPLVVATDWPFGGSPQVLARDFRMDRKVGSQWEWRGATPQQGCQPKYQLATPTQARLFRVRQLALGLGKRRRKA